MERARNRRQRPRGGYIFCDSDADNGRRNKDGLVSSKCGWRYPEAAENDLSGTCKFRDGYGYISPFFTEDGLGEGKSNTEILSRNGSPAASASENWSDGEYPSWLKPECFLPSIDELRMMYADLKAQGRNCNFEDKSYRSSSESGANDGCYVNFADRKTETFLPVPGENTKRLCLHLSRKENNLSFSGFRSDSKKTYAQLSEHVLYISRPFLICCFDMKPPVGREIPQEGLIMKIKESPDIR